MAAIAMTEAAAQEVALSQEDLTEAFFLHPADHPGSLLVSKPFDGTSFGSWKRTMLIALSTNCLLYTSPSPRD